MKRLFWIIVLICIAASSNVNALQRPEMDFKIFQFPRNMIPSINGKTDDWDIVGEEYTYGSDLLSDTEDGHGTDIDPNDFRCTVKVGWVKGLNRLYFLYEAYDDFWDFERFDELTGGYKNDMRGGYNNDIFEIAVDADLSGGPFITNPQLRDDHVNNHFSFSGYHAQNYHIFTPPVNNQWCLLWGAQPWVCRFPWANYAYDYNFKHGESGKLILECWITPFDYAPYDGPERAVISKLVEDTMIGLSWSILDFDGGGRDGHINLAHDVRMVNNASYLCAFKLMPIEEQFQPKLEARWSFKVVDMDRRLVYFKDESIGDITKWTWHFGDGETSNEQYPIHEYKKPGVYYVAWLEVEGPDGTSRHSKHWDVMIK